MGRARAGGRWKPPSTLPPLYAGNPYDPLELPRLLVEVLGYFDGSPTREALARIRAERDINVQPSLVRRLVDFGVLVASG